MTPKLIGRAKELSEAADLLVALEGGPATLLLEGQPGIGKTSLWLAIAELAEAGGARLLRAVPAYAERRLSYAGLSDLLEGIDLDAFDLPGVQRAALTTALLRGDAGAVSEPRAVFAGVVSILRTLASERPLLIAVDDVHWLDPPSARALEFAARRLRGARVGFLLAARLGETRTFADRVGKGGEHSKRIRVGPLSLAATHDVLVERLGHSYRRPTLRRIHDASHGNPLIALDIAAALGSAEATRDEPLPVPADVSSLVQLRTSRLSERTRIALLRAAVASSPTTALFGRSLAPALRTGLVRRLSLERIVFVHPLYASAVWDDASADERRAAHGAVAEQVENAEERARHLALASEGPSEAVAAELESAAAQARARGAPDLASELAGWAFALTPADDERARGERALAAAEDHIDAGSLAQARSLITRVLPAIVDDPVRSHALRLLAEIAFREGNLDEAERNLHGAALLAGDDPILRGPVERDLVLTSVFGSFGLEQARSYAEALIADAERSCDDGLLAEALAHATMIDFLRGTPIDEGRLRRALELEDHERRVPVQFTPSYLVGSLDFYRGRYRQSRSLLLALHARRRERGADAELPMVCCTLAWLECIRGDLASAKRFADDAYEAAVVTESETGAAMALVARALVDAFAGRVEACRRSIAAAIRAAERTGLGLVRLQALSFLGFLELSLGNPTAACAAFSACRRDLGEDGESTPQADEIEALIAVGGLDRAERLTESLAAWARAVDASLALAASHRCRGLLLAARGRHADALAEIETSLDQCRRLDAPLELARTLLAKGMVERRLRHKAAARESLEQALDRFEAIGASLWAERARMELARVGLRRARPGGLTEGERRVAELAAAGFKNREVAARLYMSPKTVEANLARVYRKLGINSRAELGAVIANRRAADEVAGSREPAAWPTR